MYWALVALCIGASCTAHSNLLPRLSTDDATALGKKIWLNESGASKEKLVWWNEGETFASVGIGHFLWAPQGSDIPFQESFPQVLRFMEQRSVMIPAWIKDAQYHCPWHERSQVVQSNDLRIDELRTLLSTTIDLQALFIIERSNTSIQHLLANVSAAERKLLKKRIKRLTSTTGGLFAIIDYINFKGDGTNTRERYDGKGWGLLQVLQTINDTDLNQAPENAFAQAAANVLRQRVHNAPPERNEQRWLPGWLNRVNRYKN